MFIVGQSYADVRQEYLFSLSRDLIRAALRHLDSTGEPVTTFTEAYTKVLDYVNMVLTSDKADSVPDLLHYRVKSISDSERDEVYLTVTALLQKSVAASKKE